MKTSARLPLRAWLLCLLMAILASVFCMLGVWQMQRLTWKTQLVASMDAAYAQPKRLDVFDLVKNDPASRDPFFVAYGTMTGVLFEEYSFRIAPRTRNGVVGAHVITPLIIEDPFAKGVPAILVMVNRGWIREGDPIPPVLPSGDSLITQLTFTGALRPYPRPNAFVPPNDVTQDQWAFLRENDARVRARRDFSPHTLFAPLVFEAHGPAHGGLYPMHAQDRPSNNHLSYALFWFGMTGVTILLTGFYMHRTKGMTNS